MKNYRKQSGIRLSENQYSIVKNEADQRNITVSFLLTLMIKHALKRNPIDRESEAPEKRCTLKSLNTSSLKMRRVCFKLPETNKNMVDRWSRCFGYSYALGCYLLINDVLKTGDLSNV